MIRTPLSVVCAAFKFGLVDSASGGFFVLFSFNVRRDRGGGVFGPTRECSVDLPEASWDAFSKSWKFLAVRVFLERRTHFSPDVCAADVAPRQTFKRWWCSFVCNCCLLNVEPRSFRR